MDTNFVNGTVIEASWLNDVNDHVYAVTSSEVIFITDEAYGAVGDGVTDDTSAIKLAFTAAATSKKPVIFPSCPVYYKISDEIVLPDGIETFGYGWDSRVYQSVSGKNIFVAGNNTKIHNLHFVFGVAGNALDFTKQNGVYISGKNSVTIYDNYFELNNTCSGVQSRDGKFVTVRDNFFWKGSWDGVTGGAPATAADIIFYSGTSGGKSIITNNYCLSNNSQGIFFDALGHDEDVSITENVCITMDDTLAYATAGGVRRHGIIVNYNSTNPVRANVSGNICNNTRWTGIYIQGAGNTTGGQISANNNICWRNGYDTATALSAGIFVTCNGGESIKGNIVSDFQNTVSATGGIVVTCPAAGGTSNSYVVDNMILNSATSGISIVNKMKDCTVKGNTIYNSTGSDINVSLTSGDTGLGNIQIIENSCYRSNILAPSINMSPQSGAKRNTIARNYVIGIDSATSSVTNCGIQVGSSAPKVDILDNYVTTFYYGVNFDTLFSAATRYFSVSVVDRNRIENCNQGIGASSSVGTTTLPVCDNIFDTVTTRVGTGTPAGTSCLYIGRRNGLLLEVYVSSATAPTTGTWAKGDRLVNQYATVGSPKGWQITVAGSPGTLTSEGNL